MTREEIVKASISIMIEALSTMPQECPNGSDCYDYEIDKFIEHYAKVNGVTVIRQVEHGPGGRIMGNPVIGYRD